MCIEANQSKSVGLTFRFKTNKEVHLLSKRKAFVFFL